MRPPVKWGLALGLAGVVGLGVSCIIPDRDIQVRTTDINLYPVRFVEGIPLSEEARCACSEDACECPLADATELPTFLDPVEYPFCICNENREDANRLQPTYLYVEDQDEVDGAPRDSLYAAALLDWDPTLGVPAFDYIAYRAYLDPDKSLRLTAAGSYELEVIKRPRPYVRQIELQVDASFDLCNGAGRDVGPGFHTITFMVTDRPWYERESMGPDTTGESDVEGSVVSLQGVPDIAAGATYDLQTYVFQCLQDGVDMDDCGCEDIAP